MVKAFVHLLRSLGRSRGFGVQSPADYAYLRYVLCETWPYYAYRPLRRRHAQAPCGQRRLGRLLLRVANHLQPRRVFLSTAGHADALLFDYIQAGCRAALRADAPADTPLWVVDAGRWPVGCFSACAGPVPPPQGGAESLLPPTLRVLVLTRIHRDAPSERLWRRVKADASVQSTFDFFHFGVVVTGCRLQPHHYLVSWLCV